MSLLIAFSGQGSQHRAMFNTLREDTFGKIWLAEASDILHVNLFDEGVVEKGCMDAILVQNLIAILSIGTFYALKRQTHLEIAFFCGYSLGEVCAFCVSTNMQLLDICKLVTKRALFMQQANKQETGLMALKGNINGEQVIHLTKKYACHVAIINGQDHYIVGGSRSNLGKLKDAATSMGVMKISQLAVKVASHTPLLIKATKNFQTYLNTIHVDEMQYPILNALTQEIIFDPIRMLSILAQEVSQTCHWNNVMKIAIEYGITMLLELGPGNALKKMFLNTFPRIIAYNQNEFISLTGLAKFFENLAL